MKITVLEILDVLFESTFDGISIFMMNKEAQTWLNNYLIQMSYECQVCKYKPKDVEMCEDCMS